jgi:hypothetical protein
MQLNVQGVAAMATGEVKRIRRSGVIRSRHVLLAAAIGGVAGLASMAPVARAATIASYTTLYSSGTAPSSIENLSADGTTDWAAWGKATNNTTFIEDKALSGSTPVGDISAITQNIPSGGNGQWTGGSSQNYVYSDGAQSPTLITGTTNESYDFEFITSQATASGSESFTVTVPAGSTGATLTVWDAQFTQSNPGGTTITLSSGGLASPVPGDQLTNPTTSSGYETTQFQISNLGAGPTTFTVTDAVSAAFTRSGGSNFGLNFATLAVTPEPATLGIMAFGVLGLLARRRRGSHDRA